ncbi:MAG: double zinc ribbon domain-containing protein [Qipengyuania sp.]
MGFARTISETLGPVVDMVYPPRCPACGEGIGEQSGLCPSCWEDLAIPAQPWCALCQRPFGDAVVEDGAICAPCMAEPPRHAGIAAGTLYTDTARKLVLAFKHGRRIALAPLLAKLISAKLGEPDRRQVIIPVPLHRWRLWRRGFNQAGLLAREIERLGHGTLAVDALVRRKATPSLGGLGAKARRRALAGAIGLTEKGKSTVIGRDIVLLDDVLTSGATSDACVTVLRRGGAKSVRIACFARVLNEIDSRDYVPNETPEAVTASGAT